MENRGREGQGSRGLRARDPRSHPLPIHPSNEEWVCVLSSFYNLDPEDWSVERIDGACLDGAIDGSVQQGEPLDLGALFPASAVRKTGAKSPDGRASFVLVSGPFDGSIILAPATADRFNVVCFTEDGEDAGRARMAQYSVHRRPSGEPFGTAVCTSLEYAPE